MEKSSSLQNQHHEYAFDAYGKVLAAVTTEREQLGLMRQIARGDLYCLAKEILGFDWLSAPHHTDFCRQLQHNIDRNLYLLPCSSGKTPIFTIAGAIQAYLRRPKEQKRFAQAGPWRYSRKPMAVRVV